MYIKDVEQYRCLYRRIPWLLKFWIALYKLLDVDYLILICISFRRYV